jgi:1-deoxy-D-xylulose-5-phosphate reductoisomerase
MLHSTGLLARNPRPFMAARIPEAAPKRVALLGATGSIGRSCAQVVASAPDRFAVVSVAGGRDGAALARAAIALGASFAAICDPAGYGDLKEGVAGHDIEISAGEGAIVEAACREADLVVSAIVGAVGLLPTYAAILAGRIIALANKETLVCAGAVVMRTAAKCGARLLPLDSEHNAIFQAIGDRDPGEVVRMTLTASGGPFREWSAERIAAASRAEALNHPKWAMGPKISVDSASLMNKGLELIEAHHLFGVAPDRLSVLVHPQSIVHGLVSFADGSTIAGMASPDMRTPIAHCLAHPDRVPSGVAAPDLAALGRLTFEQPDLTRFPALRIAIDALKDGEGAPTALNAANEIVVAAFLAGRIAFGAIAEFVERTLEAMRAAGETKAPATVEAAMDIHNIAQERATALVA